MRKPVPGILLLSLLALCLVSPTALTAWVWDGARLRAVELTSARPLPAPPFTDLDGDSRPEALELAGGRASIRAGNGAEWHSPLEWLVRQAEWTDLDTDGALEAALLVWRPFRPWPVSKILSAGSPIDDFHDANGQSCQLILIGWSRGAFREVWAGSALADPIQSFAAADLDGDGKQELAALEGSYDDPPGAPAQRLKLWKWDGFGFSVLASAPGRFGRLRAAQTASGQVRVLAQGVLFPHWFDGGDR